VKLEFGKLIELLGIMGVIASLLFVGIQLQLDRNVALGEQYAARSATRASMLEAILGSDLALESYAKQFEGSQPFWWHEGEPRMPLNSTPIDIAVYGIEIQLMMLGWDNIYYQNELGLFDPVEFEVRRASVKNAFRIYPSLRSYMTNPGLNYTGSIVWFQEIANELDNE